MLLLLARIIEQCFRGEDLCFRYGGEEFAIVLSRSDVAGAMTALERLRTRVEFYRAPDGFPQVGRVTVSIGCAAIQAGVDPSELIDRADKALYYAKHHGRNRVANYDAVAQQAEFDQKQRVGDIQLF